MTTLPPGAGSPRHTAPPGTAAHRPGRIQATADTAPKPPSAFGSQCWRYCRGRSPHTPRRAGLVRRPRRPREAAAGARRSPPFAQPEPGLSQSTSRDSWRSSPGPPESLRRRGSGKTARGAGAVGPRAPWRWGSCWVGKATSLLGDPATTEVSPRPRRRTCSGPADRPVLPRCTHLRRGRGAPNAAGPPVPAAGWLGPLRNPTCQEGGWSLPLGDPGPPAPWATP